MSKIITACCQTPTWIDSVLSKIAQFDDDEFEFSTGYEAKAPSPVEEEVRNFYQNVPSQVLNLKEWAKGGGKRPIAANPSAKRRANKAIHEITQSYQKEIPLNEILLAMSREGFVPLDETGSTFGQGMLVGSAECGTEEARNQYITMRLAAKNADGMWCMTTSSFHITWCTLHGSKKYEVVAYIG